MHRVSKTAVWKWVKKFSEKINVKPSNMPRRLMALDETCIKVNGLEMLIEMRFYPSRNMLVTKLFISQCLLLIMHYG